MFGGELIKLRTRATSSGGIGFLSDPSISMEFPRSVPEEANIRNPLKRMHLNGFSDSRGGTRTRDPGIMSAVL
jgi:hypothetical protein